MEHTRDPFPLSLTEFMISFKKQGTKIEATKIFRGFSMFKLYYLTLDNYTKYLSDVRSGICEVKSIT